jgi:hypothetical protein
MSYKEKSISISLVSYIMILGYYLIQVFQMIRGGGLVASRLFALWAVVIVSTILVNILGNILASIVLAIAHAIRTRSEQVEKYVEDERDRLIDLKGSKIAYITFSIGVFIAMLAFILGQSALVMFALIVFFSSAAEIVGSISQIVQYRRGF